MASTRKITFVDDYYYHVFNRGIERRITFIDKRDYKRALDLLYFYQFISIPVRYSQYNSLPQERKEELLFTMEKSGKLIDIIAYCLMPNHFHLLLRQNMKNGIKKYLSNFTNAYTKYFNTRYDRSGALFQGIFKAVYIESDDQLIHVTRYIHLNPVASSVIPEAKLELYPWSSYPKYCNIKNDYLVDSQIIQQLPIPKDYTAFTHNQMEYAKTLDSLKHLILE